MSNGSRTGPATGPKGLRVPYSLQLPDGGVEDGTTLAFPGEPGYEQHMRAATYRKTVYGAPLPFETDGQGAS